VIKPFDVIFYFPQHFNRSVNGTNPFFDPLIAICEENGLLYLLLEEPDNKTNFPRNKCAYKFDVYFYLIQFLRKIVKLFFLKNFETREQLIGFILKKITLGKFSANVVFTLSNSMGGFWRGYNPEARIIDYQHGIINSTQSGFFKKGNAAANIRENNKEVAVWGVGFKDVFKQDKRYYKNKVHVLGYSQLNEKGLKSDVRKNKIIISLQFMPEFGIKLNQEMLFELKRVLKELNSVPNEIKHQVVLKNHPRHNNAVDLKNIIDEFDFVTLMLDKEELNYPEYLLHVTFYSTMAFEMAIKGIPTYFLVTENIINGKTQFLEEYQYPINQNFTLQKLWSIYENDGKVWLDHSGLVKKWSMHFFAPLDKGLFLDLIQHNKH
jgi:hypothetical protein